jgi:hypothetical protein
VPTTGAATAQQASAGSREHPASSDGEPAGPATAEDDSAPTGVAERAALLFEDGVAALKSGRFDEAARSFEASYALEPRVAALCNLALTYDRWGSHEHQAAEAYRRCSEEDESGRFRQYAEHRAEALGAATGANAAGGAEQEAPVRPEPATEREDTEPEVLAQRRREDAAAGFAPGPRPPDRPRADEGQPGRRRAPLYLGLGVAAGAAGAAIAGAVMAVNAGDDLDELQSRYPDGLVTDPSDAMQLQAIDDDIRRARRLYIAAGILGAAAASLITVDLALRHRARGTEAKARLQLRPRLRGAMITAELDLP